MPIKTYPFCTTCKAWDKPLHLNCTGKVSVNLMCRDCRREKQKKYYHQNKKKCREIVYKSIRKHQHKQDARVQVRLAIERGDLVRPEQCSKCSSTGRIEAAHVDYSRPLDVRWLCKPCHYAFDNKTT